MPYTEESPRLFSLAYRMLGSAAATLERTEPACRQLFHRAKAHVDPAIPILSAHSTRTHSTRGLQ